jgi:hypothetical protein
MRPYLRALFVLVGGALLLGESTAFAQRYYYGPPPPRYYRPRYAPPYYSPYSHDGFFLRLTGGVGYLAASETVDGATLGYSGFGFTFGGALGGAVAPNLIVFGEIVGTTAFNADQSYAGSPQGLSGLDVTLLGVGPGIAYYIEPANVYLSGTLVYSTERFECRPISGSIPWILGESKPFGALGPSRRRIRPCATAARDRRRYPGISHRTAARSECCDLRCP